MVHKGKTDTPAQEGLRPQPRSNATQEEAGVDAARKLFRSHGWLFQEVDERNDFGKDAYVDLPAEDGLTGITLALQIKSGPSFKNKYGYSIPVKQHRLTWIESTVPVFGLVHDDNSGDLFWVDITQYLRDRADVNVRSVRIPPTQVLNKATLESEFRAAALKAWDMTQGAVFLLNLLQTQEELQMSAVYDCLSLARNEPKFVLLLRGCIKHLRGDALRAALWVLGHFVPSRRLWADELAWIRQARGSLRSAMHLDAEEIAIVTDEMEEDDWSVGQSINELLWLVTDDPDGLLKLKLALEYAIARGMTSSAMGIFEMICFLAGENGLSRYREVQTTYPAVMGLPGAMDLAKHLEEFGELSLFPWAIDDLVRHAGRISKSWPKP